MIAYKQPVTLPEIIELRGVKSGGVVKTLLEKRLIRIMGRKEVVGRPMLYGTTKQFLLHFGLKDLGELPKIEEFAEVLGEEVDVAGLKRAIEAPRPVEVPLSDEGEQIPLVEAAGRGGDETAASEAGDAQADGDDGAERPGIPKIDKIEERCGRAPPEDPGARGLRVAARGRAADARGPRHRERRDREGARHQGRPRHGRRARRRRAREGPEGARLPGAQQAARRRQHAQRSRAAPDRDGPGAGVAGLFPVGRLDVTTEGLILLTNDGAFAERVAHPRYEVPRVYHAKVHARPGRGRRSSGCGAGVRVEGDSMAVDRARVVEADNNAWVELTLHEGKQHEVKRLLEAVGHPVSKLRRVAIGPVTRGPEPRPVPRAHARGDRGPAEAAAKRPAPRPSGPRPSAAAPAGGRAGGAPRSRQGPSARPRSS